MRFRKFTIQNYRAVAMAELSMGNRLIPLVGINESGKTSILQAVFAFDKNSDRYGGGTHLEYRNKYQIGDHDCTITAEVIVDREQDINAISRRMKLPRGHILLEYLKRAKDAHTPIFLHRDLNNRTYSVTGLDVPLERATELAKALYAQLPLILYFDDFTERVPHYIDFGRADNKRGYKLKTSKLAEWQRILEEVFHRATDGQHTIRSFMDMKDLDERDGLLEDINDVINAEVMEAWRELKNVVSEPADDPSHLELELRFAARSQHTFRAQFRVADRSSDKKRFFAITDRSKGFQWFFNFQMKLKFNPKYQRTAEGAIYLLDEPGSYLHSSGQSQLLRTLREISKTNTILYCTHSQHLLDPERINIGHTRIVEKEEGTIKVIPFGSAGSGHQGALSPVYDALHLKTGIFNRELKKIVITEGITDFYFFTMLKAYHLPSRSKGKRVEFIPGAGAQQLRDLISMAIAWSDEYFVFLDNDEEGRKARSRYVEFFGFGEQENIILYTTPTQPEEQTLEDFLSTADADRLLGLTDTSNLKAAITALFFSSSADQKSFFGKTDSVTSENVSLMVGLLERLGR